MSTSENSRNRVMRGETLESCPVKALLQNRRWLRRDAPFPHIVAYDVFPPHIYEELRNAFAQLLQSSDSGLFGLGSLRKRSAYDVHSVGFHPGMTGPFRLFISQEWHDLLARLLGIDATGDINGGLHHHRIGSESGRVHNDLNPGWFVPPQDGQFINVSSDSCDYYSGATLEPALPVRESIRAGAMLFYLNNGVWQPGDGGETGLYVSRDSDASTCVPPIDNSLLLFECTPYSYHRFLSNRRTPRNSLILWIHRRKEEAVARWGSDKIVNWPAHPKN